MKGETLGLEEGEKAGVAGSEKGVGRVAGV